MFKLIFRFFLFILYDWVGEEEERVKKGEYKSQSKQQEVEIKITGIFFNFLWESLVDLKMVDF